MLREGQTGSLGSHLEGLLGDVLALSTEAGQAREKVLKIEC